MWTRTLAFLSSVAAVALAPAVARADGAASYVVPPPSAAVAAGVDLGKIAVPGLKLHVRDDRAPEHGGVALSFADERSRVRVVVRIAVARDGAAARAYVEGALRGVSGVLSPSTLDDVAFADPQDRLVVASRGNVAYVVEVLDGSLASASSVVGAVRRAFVSGTPDFPRATVSVPKSFEGSAPVTVTVSRGARYRLSARGAYVARGRDASPVLKAFGRGPVELTAIVADDLGRVTEVTTAATAR
jgi:hypothetical protein